MTLAVTTRQIVNGVAGPIIGHLVDRIGARIVMTSGALIGGMSLLAIAASSQPWHFYLLYGVLGAIGVAEFGGLVTSAVVAKWFVRKRGRAIAFTTMGISLGGAVMIPVTAYVIDQFGWRMAWIVSGLLIIVLVTLPSFIFMRNTPEDMGLRPDGDPVEPQEADLTDGASAAQRRTASQEQIWTLGEALRTPSLWLMVLAFGLSSMGLSTMILHQIAYIQDKGFVQLAATASSITALSAFFCKPVWGFLLERFPPRYCAAAAYLCAALGLVILIYADSAPMVLLYSVVFGFGMGSGPVLDPVFFADYYGRTFVGTIRGFVMPIRTVFATFSPIFAAYVFDHLGNYQLAVVFLVGSYVLAAFVIFLTKKPLHSSLKVTADQSDL